MSVSKRSFTGSSQYRGATGSADGRVSLESAALVRADQTSFEQLVTDILARFMTVSEETDGLLDLSLKEFATFLDIDRLVYIEVDVEHSNFKPTRQWIRDGVVLNKFAQYSDIAPLFPWLMAKLAGAETVAIDSLDDFPDEASDERQYCESMNIKTLVMIPAQVDERVVAALALDDFREPRNWSAAELQRLRVFAEIVASAYERDKARQQVNEMRRFENAMADISNTFVNLPSDEVDKKIEAALGVVAKALGGELSALLQPVPDDYHITHEWSSEKISSHTRLGRSCKNDYPWLFERLNENKVIEVSSPADLTDAAVIERDKSVGPDIMAAIWVPFEIAGELAGHLHVSTSEPRQWPPEAVVRLRLMGEVFGQAIRRKQSDEQLQASFREIEALKDQLREENLYLRKEIKLAKHYGGIVGDSAPLVAALEKVEQVAPTDSTVLILGETGTGKELLARSIHEQSARKNQIMVKVNCAALPSELVEAELFGREKGAFTGALTRELGRFEMADGSTIFLDEIGEMSLALQAKLLRVLQDGEFERLGSSVTRTADVRIVAATNRGLAEAVEQGEFREDLYYRLNVFPIELPPLRDRADDIPLLVWTFVKEFSETMGKTIESIPRDVMDSLQSYQWPGNVREVRNVVERAMIVSRGPGLDIDLPQEATGASRKSSRLLDDVQREHILNVVESTDWRISGEGGAAELLGLKPTTLDARMKKLGIQRPKKR